MSHLDEKYVIDGAGKKSAIILPYAKWKKIIVDLEEYDAIKAYDKAKSQKSDSMPLKAALRLLKTKKK